MKSENRKRRKQNIYVVWPLAYAHGGEKMVLKRGVQIVRKTFKTLYPRITLNL